MNLKDLFLANCFGGGSGGGSGGGVCSWNDLTDKPFGEQSGFSEVYVTENISLTAPAWNLLAFKLIEGETYKVVLGGNEYTCVAQPGEIEIEEEYGAYTYSGAYIGSDDHSEYPFYMFCTEGSSSSWVIVPEAVETSLAVYKWETVVHCLDEKYIPNTIACDWDNVNNKPFGVLVSQDNVYLMSGVSVTLDNADTYKTISTGKKLVAGKRYNLAVDGSSLGWVTAYNYDSVPDYVYADFEGFSLAYIEGMLQMKATTAGTYTINRIMGYAEYYTKIPKDYLTKAVAVADAAGDAPTAAEFNALLTALRNAGYLATE